MMFSMILEVLEQRALMSAAAATSVPMQVSSSSATTAPATVTAPKNVSIFSWSKTRDASSIQGMYWASLDQDPIAEANRIAPLLMQAKAGTRTVFLWHSMISAFTKFNLANPGAFVASGPDITHDHAWSQTFFTRLKALGAQVDRVASDNEGGFSTWVLFSNAPTSAQQVAMMQNIYSNPAAFAKLPASLKAFTAADFASPYTARGNSAYLAWNDWAKSVVDQSYKAATIAPIQQIYGNTVAVSNFGDIAAKTQVLDKNGWPLAEANAGVPGNVSSPECYILNGNKFANLNLKKDWRWNRFIDILNTVRAAQNDPATTVTPWISFPSFRGDNTPQAKSTWLWEQMVRQMVGNGISSFYYWNPAEVTTRSDDQFAASLFKTLTPGTPTAQSLAPIPFDANQVVSGNVVTTYADFLKFVDAPGATSMNPSVPAAPPPANPVTPPPTPTGQLTPADPTQPVSAGPTILNPIPTSPVHVVPTRTTLPTRPTRPQWLSTYYVTNAGPQQSYSLVSQPKTTILSSDSNLDDLLDLLNHG